MKKQKTKNMLSAIAFATVAVATLPAAQAGILPFHGFAAGLGVGTEGVGIQGTTAIVPKVLNLNLGVNYFHYSGSFASGGVDYHAGATLQGEPITVSWFPFEGNFNLTAGLFINQNAFDVTGTPAADGTYTINGHLYTASQVGTLSGQTNFNAVAPYVGIGWGDPMDGGRLTFTANVGAIYQGAANVTLNATGAAADPALASDVQAAQNDVNSHLDAYQWWPVVGLGLAYRF